LVPVYRKGAAAAGAGAAQGGITTVEGVPAPDHPEFFVPVERQQQIGVTYAMAQRAPLRQVIRAAGTIAPDSTRRWEYTARTEGYVEKLHVTSAGEPVKKDQALLTVYSPDLLITQTDYVRQLEAR